MAASQPPKDGTMNSSQPLVSESMAASAGPTKAKTPGKVCPLCSFKCGGVKDHIYRSHLPWYLTPRRMWEGTEKEALQSQRGELISDFLWKEILTRQHRRTKAIQPGGLPRCVARDEWWLNRYCITLGEEERHIAASLAYYLQERTPTEEQVHAMKEVVHLKHWRALMVLMLMVTDPANRTLLSGYEPSAVSAPGDDLGPGPKVTVT